MGQILVRNLDDDTIAAYREAAKRHNRSLEAEVRDLITRWKPMTAERKADLQRRFAELRAMTPDVPQTPAEAIIRELRDS